MTPHVATVRSSGAGTSGGASSQRALVQAVVGQLLMAGDGADGEEADVKRANLVLPVLEAWYDNQYPRCSQSVRRPPGSPAKKRARRSGPETEAVRPPLVVILEDFEGFPAGLMQDFVLNLM